jgi:hypothetical protein
VAGGGSGAKDTRWGVAIGRQGSNLIGKGLVGIPALRHGMSDGGSATLRGGSRRSRSGTGAGDGSLSGLMIDVRMFVNSVSAL